VGRHGAVDRIRCHPPELERCLPGVEGDGGRSGEGRGGEDKDTGGRTLGRRRGPDGGIQGDGGILALIPVVANGPAATDTGAVAVFAGKLAEAVVVRGRVEVVSRHVRLGRCLNQDAGRGTGASVDGAEAKMASKVAEALEGAGAGSPRACGRQERRVAQDDAVVGSLTANRVRAVPVVAVETAEPREGAALPGERISRHSRLVGGIGDGLLEASTSGAGAAR
jgi:hypothetical protein